MVRNAGFKKDEGFTLVEMIVAMALFVIVVSIIVGIFLRTVQSERGVANQAAAVSNVALAMEEMAREMRTGNGFEIICPPEENGCLSSSNGVWSNKMSFNYKSSDGSYGVTYSLVNGQIIRTATTGGSPAPTGAITADTVKIDYLKFYNCAATQSAAPRIVIAIEAEPKTLTPGFGKTFNLETTVSERLYYYEQAALQLTPVSCPHA